MQRAILEPDKGKEKAVVIAETAPDQEDDPAQLGIECSISYLLFLNPVSTICDHTFESDHINRWLKSESTCPLCRHKGIKSSDLKSNSKIKDKVIEYLIKHPEQRVAQYFETTRLMQLLSNYEPTDDAREKKLVQIFATRPEQVTHPHDVFNKRTILDVLLEKQCPTTIEKLLALPGVCITLGSEEGQSLFYAAAKQDWINIIKFFLNHTPDVFMEAKYKAILEQADVLANEGKHSDVIVLLESLEHKLEKIRSQLLKGDYMKSAEFAANIYFNYGKASLKSFFDEARSLICFHLFNTTLLINVIERALEKGDDDFIMYLYRHSSTKTPPTFDGKTLVHTLMLAGHDRLALRVLRSKRHDASVSQTIRAPATAHLGETPLHLVKSAELCSQLLAFGADPAALCNAGNTPLMTALREKHSRAVHVLIAERPNDLKVNQKNHHGQSALHIAVWNVIANNRNEAELKKILALPDIDVNILNKNGESILHFAVRSGNRELVALLLDVPGMGVEMQFQGLTAEDIAKKGGVLNGEMIALFYSPERKFDLIKKLLDDNQNMSLAVETLATIYRHHGANAINYLLGNLFLTLPKSSVLNLCCCQLLEHIADNALRKKNYDLVMALYSSARAADYQPRIGDKTLLQMAIEQDKEELVSTLLNLDAEKCELHAATTRCQAGRTALHFAAQSPNKNYCDWLLTAGSDVDAICREGSTALLLAVSAGRTCNARVLLNATSSNQEQLSNINQANKTGLTPLHAAVRKSSLRMLNLLLSEPTIDVNVVLNEDGITPLIEAASLGKVEFVAALLMMPTIDVDARTKGNFFGSKTAYDLARAMYHQRHSVDNAPAERYQQVIALLDTPEIRMNTIQKQLAAKEVDRTSQRLADVYLLHGKDVALSLLIELKSICPDLHSSLCSKLFILLFSAAWREQQWDFIVSLAKMMPVNDLNQPVHASETLVQLMVAKKAVPAALLEPLLEIAGLELNLQNAQQKTPLLVAATSGQQQKTYLLAAANVHVKAEDNMITLTIAAKEGWLDVVTTIFNKLDPTIEEKPKAQIAQAIKFAKLAKHEKVVALLNTPQVKHGYAITELNQGNVAEAAVTLSWLYREHGNAKLKIFLNKLQRTHANSYASLCKHLLTQIINLAMWNEHDDLIIHLATFLSQNELNQPLGQSKFSLLHLAVNRGSHELVSRVLKIEGIDVNLYNDAGETPLVEAIMRRYPEKIKRLLAHPDIDVNRPCPPHGRGDGIPCKTAAKIAEKCGVALIADLFRARALVIDIAAGHSALEKKALAFLSKLDQATLDAAFHAANAANCTQDELDRAHFVIEQIRAYRLSPPPQQVALNIPGDAFNDPEKIKQYEQLFAIARYNRMQTTDSAKWKYVRSDDGWEAKIRQALSTAFLTSQHSLSPQQKLIQLHNAKSWKFFTEHKDNRHNFKFGSVISYFRPITNTEKILDHKIKKNEVKIGTNHAKPAWWRIFFCMSPYVETERTRKKGKKKIL